MTVRVWVEAVGLLGPGPAGWEAARAVLAGNARYCPAAVVLPPPAQLSPAERRRAIPSVRLALAAAEEAVTASGRAASSLAAVFASSGPDGETIGAVLSALALPAREVSPTRFHNSVHNAPSGYWSLAVQSREPATSLSGYDGTFAAGLLEAGVQAADGARAVLLAAYDLSYPAPLDRVRPLQGAFGTALVLAPVRTDAALACLELMLDDEPSTDGCADPALECLRRHNPAARALPLLAAFAARATARVRLELGRASLAVAVAPC